MTMNCRGFTLIETIVALLIFSISAGTVMLLVSQNFKANRRAKNYIIAESAFYNAYYSVLKEDNIDESEFKVKCDEDEDIECEVNIVPLSETLIVNNEEITVENENYLTVKIIVPVGEYKYEFKKIIEKK